MDKKSIPTILAEEILEKVGGKENIAAVNYCMTRLRLTLRDEALADKKELKAINGVMGVVTQAGQLQIILGPGTVNKVAAEVGKKTSLRVGQIDEATVRKEELKKKNATPFKLFLKKLSNIFMPLIPAFVGCGIIYGFAKLFENMGLISGNTYNILYVIGKAVFLYMNIMVGMYTAREFGGSEALGGSIAGILSASALSKIVIGGVPLVPEEGGVFAVLLACMAGAYLEKKLRKVMHPVLDMLVTPTVVLLVIGFGALYIFHPLGRALSNSLTWAVTASIAKGKVLTGGIFSVSFLPLVMTGLHRALTPVEVSLLKQTNIDLLRPILAMAGAGQVGAGIAIYMKTKSKKIKTIVASSLPVAMLGVGEPLMFGVTLPLGKPFLTACLGSAFGGMYVAAMGVGSTGIGLSGLPLTLLIPGSKAVHYLIGTILAYAGGFLLTYFTKWEDYKDDVEEASEIENPATIQA